MTLRVGEKLTIGTYTALDGEKNIVGVVKQTGLKTKEEAVKAAYNDNSFWIRWFGVGELTHSAIYKEPNGSYCLLKIDKDYSTSIAYGENSRSSGIAKENFEFID